MPYSRTPQQSTYTVKPVKLLDMLDSRNRTGTTDAYVSNGHVELYKDKNIGDGDYEIVKRSGLTNYPYTSGSVNIRGTYYWREQSKIFVAKDSSIDIVNSTTGSLITTITPFTTTTGDVGFTEYEYDTGVVVLIATDGTTPVYIKTDNTYTVASTTRTADATWTANTAYVVDQVIAPTVANGYLFKVSVGGTSGATEPPWALAEGAETDDNTVVYDAVSINNALPIPHLPYPLFLDGYLFLAKMGTADIYNSDLNDPTVFTAGSFISAEMVSDSIVRISKMNNYLLAFGTASIEYFWDAANATGSPLQRNDTPVKFVGYIGGFAQIGNIILFMGAAVGGSPAIYMLEDFKISTVSTLPVRKYILPFASSNASIVSYGGKDFYILAGDSLTFAVDLDSGMWSRISLANRTDFPLYHSLSIFYPGYGNTTLCFFSVTGQTLYFDQNAFQDAGTNFIFEIQSDPIMFDTNRYKTVSRTIVISDQASVSSLLSLSWTDDGYNTWNTVRTVDVGTNNPVLFRCGRFRKRAVKLSYTDNYPMRIKALEMDINIGER